MRHTVQLNTSDYNGSAGRSMLNPSIGGQFGYMPQVARDIAKTKVEEWISNAAHVSFNLIPFVLRTPKIFDVIEDKELGKKLKRAYIDIFTLQQEKITGFKRTLTIDTDEHDFGSGGEKHEEFVLAKKERSKVSYEFTDKLGESISRFMEFMLSYGILDHRTQTALITTISGKELRKGNLYTPDYYTGTHMFVELDRVNINVQNAYIVYNHAPTTTGELTNQRSLNEAMKVQRLTIPTTGITDSSEAARAYAQNYIDDISILRTNPDDITYVGVTAAEASTVSGTSGGFNQDTYVSKADGYAEKKGFADNANTAFGA